MKEVRTGWSRDQKMAAAVVVGMTAFSRRRCLPTGRVSGTWSESRAGAARPRERSGDPVVLHFYVGRRKKRGQHVQRVNAVFC